MSALVRFGRRQAILREGRWVSANVAFEEALNQHTASWFQQGLGPPARASDQELAVAEEIARQFGGKLAVHIKPRRAAEKHFLNHRQLGFDF